MSTYWGYRCQTCGVNSDEWFNHGDGELSEMYQQWPALQAALAAVEHANWRFGLTLSDHGQQVVAFLQEHNGHVLVLHNEYNDIRDLQTPAPSGVSTEGAAWAMDEADV